MRKPFILLATMAFAALSGQAKVKLPHIICDNMVLLQNTEARLWGWDKPGTTVAVTVSWNQQVYKAKTGKDGRWLVKVATPAA